MIAVTLSNNQIEIKELPVPQIKPDQVLIKVYTCGLNRSDLLETQGQSFGHSGGEHKIIGGEFAGKIVELGKSVNNFNIGDNVMCRGGSGWAEYAVGNFKRIVKLDTDKITWEQGASIQGSLQTMHDAIVTNGKFVKGQTVFIQGATSGVGLIGLQIAKSLGASKVFGSSTNRRLPIPMYRCLCRNKNNRCAPGYSRQSAVPISSLTRGREISTSLGAYTRRGLRMERQLDWYPPEGRKTFRQELIHRFQNAAVQQRRWWPPRRVLEGTRKLSSSTCF